MGDPFKSINGVKPDDKLEPQTRIVGFMGSVVVLCRCGSQMPILVPILPGSNMSSVCLACQRTLHVEKVDYSEQRGEPTPIRCKIGVRDVEPSHIVAATSIPPELVRG